MNDNENPPGTMKNQPGTMKNNENPPGTMKNQLGVVQGGYRWFQETPRRKWSFFVSHANRHTLHHISSSSPIKENMVSWMKYQKGKQKEDSPRRLCGMTLKKFDSLSITSKISVKTANLFHETFPYYLMVIFFKVLKLGKNCGFLSHCKIVEKKQWNSDAEDSVHKK